MVLTPAQAKALDDAAEAAGLSLAQMMEAAGKAVADVVNAFAGDPRDFDGRILILVGPGNNGGDGLVAARALSDWGYHVSVMVPGGVDSLGGLARKMFGLWTGETAGFEPLLVASADIIVDALFGVGQNRPLDGDYASVVTAANKAAATRIAVDICSGLDGESGFPTGVCFQADATVTFCARKTGHLIAPGRFVSGGINSLFVADIGVPPRVVDSVAGQFFENDPVLWSGDFPVSGPHMHKYDRGHALVLGGKEPALGACRLTALAALRVGAGLVTLAASPETYAIQATALTDIMVRRFDSIFGFVGMLADERINTVVMGPGAGVGEKTAELVSEVLALRRRVVLDADSLTSLASRPQWTEVVKGADVVMTPHDGEFRRLFQGYGLKKNRLKAALDAATYSGAIIVLKGVSTIIASPDGRAAISTNAPSNLSTAGSGDVLTGLIAGLMAQGMPSFEAACAGVWGHGEAASLAGPAMIASDMLTVLGRVYYR